MATYYRGRTTMGELMDMPLDYINTLYSIAEARIAEEEKKREEERQAGKPPTMSSHAAMALEDELQEVLG